MLVGRVHKPIRAAVSLVVALVLGGVVPTVGDASVVTPAHVAQLSARFTTAVESTFDASWNHYHSRIRGRPRNEWHRYDHGVLTTPTRVRLRCASAGGFGGSTRYTWAVHSPTGASVQVSQAVPTLCSASFATHAEGRFTVTLTVSNGSERATDSSTVRVNHKLIVSFGDSLSSGEGNPPFVDERCHRSRLSGPARAAKRLESASTTVTFISFACSGDEIDKGINGPSDGQDPPADGCTLTGTLGTPKCPKLRAQIDAATDLLCGGRSSCPANAPHVDAVFLDIGLNDIGFSGIISRCAGFSSCVNDPDLERGFTTGLDQMRAGFARLATRFRVRPFADARIFLLQYPDDAFDSGDRHDNSGCGALLEITPQEAAFLQIEGQRINSALLGAAAVHDWTPVPVAQRFAGHGYCADESWLIGLVSSEVSQGTEDGTLHPNASGHKAIADELVDAFSSPFVPRFRTGSVTVKFDSVAIHDDQAVQPDGLAPDHTIAAFGFQTASTQYGVPISQAPGILYPDHLARIATDRPTQLPSNIHQTVTVYNKNPLIVRVYTSTLPLNVPSSIPVTLPLRPPGGPPGDPTAPNPLVPDPGNPHPRFLQITLKHGPADHYGASSATTVGTGSHTARRHTQLGTIEVRYRVTIEPPRTQAQG